MQITSAAHAIERPALPITGSASARIRFGTIQPLPSANPQPSLQPRSVKGGRFSGVVQQLKALALILKEWLQNPKEAFRRHVENMLLFHPVSPTNREFLQSTELKAKIQDVTFTTQDGVKLHAWFIPPEPGKEIVLMAHGNAGNISYKEPSIGTFSKEGFGVLAFDYRGFGNSEGELSEKGFYLDFQAAVDYLKGLKIENKDRTYRPVDPKRDIIAMGESLGGAMAIEAASRQPFRALVVSATFTSMPEVAMGVKKDIPILKWIPKFLVKNILQQTFPSESRIGQVACPFLDIHGTEDLLIPKEMGDRLVQGASRSSWKEQLIIPGGDHNDLFLRGPGRIVETVKALLAKTAPQAPEA